MKGHTITVERVGKHIRVEIGGQTVADSADALVLHESNLPDRYYIPPKDVLFDLLNATDHHTHCPFKGDASYWSYSVEGVVPDNIAWGYPDPIPAVSEIKDHVAFYSKHADVIVDGVKVSD